MQTFRISQEQGTATEKRPQDDALERALNSRSFLYEDPGSYRAGVSAALAAVRERDAGPAG